MQLNNKWFLTYKLFNSTFTGLSVGILFTIYNPLDPEIYSLGGIVLASAMLILAKFYEKLLNIKSFYFISFLVEFCMLITVFIFLLLKYSLASALIIYILYQFSFIFGGYLVRAETLVAQSKELLAKIDINKQIGYLLGLALSYLFYKILDNIFNITETKNQIIILHYILLILQFSILVFLLLSFDKKVECNK